MSNRRNFIKKAGILSAFLALNPWKAEELIPQKSKKIKKPVVLSTWRFGLQANEEACKLIFNQIIFKKIKSAKFY